MPVKTVKITTLLWGIVAAPFIAQAQPYNLAFEVRKATSAKSAKDTSTSPAIAPAWRVGMQTPLLPNLLTGSGELLYSAPIESTFSSARSELDPYLVNVDLKGKHQHLNYGADYYAVGHDYEGAFNSKYRDRQGQNGIDAWLSWTLAQVLFKTQYTKSWDNGTQGTTPLRGFDQWYELETSCPLTRTPYTDISFSYALGDRLRTSDSPYNAPYQGPLNSFKARFGLSDPLYAFSSELKQTTAKNTLSVNEQLQQSSLMLSQTLFPKRAVSVTSSYGLKVEKHTNAALKRAATLSESSVSLVYRPSHLPSKLKLSSAFHQNRTDDGSQDLQTMKLGAQLDWTSQLNESGLKAQWSVDLRYKQTSNLLNPALRASDLSVNLLWRVPLS